MLDGKTVIQKRRIDNDFVIKDILIGSDKFTERLKLYSARDIRIALKKYGFRVREMFGDYYGNEFRNKTSGRLVIFAQKI